MTKNSYRSKMAAAMPVANRKPPLQRLMTGLTATAAALALILATALPSHADKRSDDLAKVLAAAIILGIIVNHAGHATPKPAPVPVPVGRPRVPAVCATEIETSDGYDTIVVYPESCLREEGFRAALPGCVRLVRIYGQRERVYTARCLREAGFRVGGGY